MNLFASVSVLVLLIGLSNGQTTVSPCTIEFNADYLYNDIRNEFVATAGACQDLCYAYPTCQSWSYVIVTNACWLKSANRANRVDSQGRKIKLASIFKGSKFSTLCVSLQVFIYSLFTCLL